MGWVKAPILIAAAFGLVLGCVVLGRAATNGIPACGPDQVPSATTVAQVRRNVVTGLAVVATWGTSPCRLHARLTFTVKRFTQRVSPGGAVRTIHGNPALTRVDVVLKPGAVLAASWRWRNWCGRSGRFQLQANFSNWPYLAVPSHAVAPPRCTSPERPSTLVRVPVAVRPCPSGGDRLRPGVGGGFMQSLIVGVRIERRAHRAPCLLTHAKVTFALQRQMSGRWVTIREIDGNPGHRKIGALLAAGEPGTVFWAWRNWCGGGGRFRSFARVDERIAAGPVFAQPISCQDPKAPSTLRPSYGHG